MHADVHRTIVIEMSPAEASALYTSLSNALAAIDKGQVYAPSVDKDRLEKFAAILDDVRDE